MTGATAVRTVPARPTAVQVPWLARCDPTVLLGVVVATPLVLVRVFDPLPLVALWLLGLVGARCAAGVTWRRLVLAQLPFAWFAMSLVVVNAVTRGGDVVAVVGPLEVTDLGLGTGVALAVRTLVTGVCATAFLTVADPVRLLGSLLVVGRLPVRTAAALLAAHRLLEDLPDDWASTRRAHTVREPPGRRTGGSAAAFGRAAFALLASSVRRAERVAVSLESRALGALPRHERTVWRPASTSRADAVLVAVVGSVVGAVVLVLGPLLGPLDLAP